MKITHRIHEVISGAPLSIPITATGSWSDSLTSKGSGRFQIPLALTRFTPEDWQASTLHWFHMIAEYWDNHPVFFGLIAKKAWDFETQVLTLDTVTVDDLFYNRFTFGVNNYENGDLTIESQTLRAAMVQVLKRGMQWGGTWPLPLNFLAPEFEPGTFTQAWKNHDYKRISDLIDIIQSQEGGPDLAYIPQVDENFNARWDVHIGSPRITGKTIDLPMSVRQSRARGAQLIEDGRGMLSGTITKGEGFGKIRPHGWAGFMGGPVMAVRDSARDVVALDSRLDSIAKEDLAAVRSPLNQYEFELFVGDRGTPFPIRDFRLGTRLNLRHSGDAYRRPESQMQYVVARSHDTSNPDTVRPEVQPA